MGRRRPRQRNQSSSKCNRGELEREVNSDWAPSTRTSYPILIGLVVTLGRWNKRDTNEKSVAAEILWYQTAVRLKAKRLIGLQSDSPKRPKTYKTLEMFPRPLGTRTNERPALSFEERTIHGSEEHSNILTGWKLYETTRESSWPSYNVCCCFICNGLRMLWGLQNALKHDTGSC